ncbi:signal transduction histidine kinase : CheA signal transduction histidine kinase OS=Desulfohalobium retbaense (strain DSM 5692) GN=Dret_0656 PE=4 SV=1: Hpt: Hpt: H-kinase_dim: HATPase_c: CheW [Gemmataceae bacterium]|nr:signal transduction histidine kinase : CheA signal transduction histidine kinase OS=Desulfohalobium retbaense (strain DSM 5692) GN=Dret_0656 PE=4 SV=1: Hpt: Hpt: H-kinase_dim: HATPase_c: CheW [Gemmataceae bacterium]VTT97878.1 signal transduction histidine kinase : CheA signal transduction histidine kinase OS=Desulfohalobium retbaense (strain DSM 5692) GN=Dret_0656 PE=4 SV=1: Hpt: Hpt: H-kinase_dim: HATPase_c: CheW [Gemmataceae bacterium]
MQLDVARYRETFFAEAAENLADLDVALLKLEADPLDREAVATAFRLVHSLKGSADAVGFPDLVRFAHHIEDVLSRLRDDTSAVPLARVDALLRASNHLAAMVAAVRAGGPVPAGGDELAAVLSGTGDRTAAPVCGAYRVTVAPAPEAFLSGLDPLRLIQDLAGVGRVTGVHLNTDRLPRLAALDPERCYLSWEVCVETSGTPGDLADVFAFARHAIEVTVEPVERVAPPTAEPAADVPRLDPLWFGAFLCKRGTITADQLATALAFVRRARPMIGVLAIQEGLLTADQMTEVLSAMGPGERFGEAVVRLGYLTDADLWNLFLLHQDGFPTLGGVLVELGMIAPGVLASEAAAFSAFAAGDGEAGAPGDSPAAEPAAADLDYGVLAENAEMIAEFCTEADDHLLAADRHLLELDADPANKKAVDAIYRGYHTIKGVSSMLGLRAVQGLAHEAENLLNMARDGKVVLRGRPLDLAFAATDGLKRQLGFVRDWLQHRGLMEADPLLGQLVSDLRVVAAGADGPAAHAAGPRGAAPDQPRPAEPAPRAAAAPASVPAPVERAARGAVVAPSPLDPPPPRRSGAPEKETVRVDRDRLDKLVNVIGELVVAQAMAEEEMAEVARRVGVELRAMSELSKISRSLQELGLSLRMVPLQGIFQKMNRLVRDLSRKMDKPVEFEMNGEDTELDKTVVDQLGDPLMHMVRNAVDHGLESPAERVAAGKPATGRVSLRAYHQGGNIYIELADDGKGLDRDRILRKAVEKGIVPEGQKLSDGDTYDLIFEPGFSTAKAVTDVSGRGVGMDVVRRNVESLHGGIVIRTELGRGTTFTIRLPLTLAIMDGLMVGLGDDVYLLPLLSVIESFRPRRAELYTLAGRGEVVTARGEAIPLLRLHALLGRPVRVTDPCQGLVVLVEDQGKKYALLVDELLGQMQVVVKSLDTNFRRVEGLTGATILGDGRVAMILDVHGLTKLHGQSGGSRSEAGHAARAAI